MTPNDSCALRPLADAVLPFVTGGSEKPTGQSRNPEPQSPATVPPLAPPGWDPDVIAS
jgi:hypothetical protein